MMVRFCLNAVQAVRQALPGPSNADAQDSSNANQCAAGDYQPVQQDQLDLSCLVDCAYSMANWSMNHSTSKSTSLASPVRPTVSHGGAAARDSDLSPELPEFSGELTAADLAALDSMYTALSTFGVPHVRTLSIFDCRNCDELINCL
jgi:hypothetical protein